MKRFDSDKVYDIEREAFRCIEHAKKYPNEHGDRRAVWWNDPRSGRFSTLRYTARPIMGAEVTDPNNRLWPQFAVSFPPCDRFSLYITLAKKNVFSTTAVPEKIRVQLRVGYEAVVTVAATRDIQIPTWETDDTQGFIFQYTGLVATRAEVYAATFLDVGTPREIELFWAILVAYTGGCCGDDAVVDGPYVI